MTSMIDNDNDMAMDIDDDNDDINKLIGGEVDTAPDINLTNVNGLNSARNSFTYADEGPIPIDAESGDNSWLDCLVFGKPDNLDKSITPRSSTEMPIGSTGGSGSNSKKRPFENIDNTDDKDAGPKDEAKTFWDSCVSGRSQVYGGTPTSKYNGLKHVQYIYT